MFRMKYLSHPGKSKITVEGKKKHLEDKIGKCEYNTKIVLKRNVGR